MNLHIEPWMDAYLDGELNALQRRHADAHLAACPHCRAELARRRALSGLMLSVPGAPQTKSAERFRAEVSLQMQRRPAAPRRIAWGQVAFNAVPLALLAALVFIEIVAALSSLVTLVPGLEPVVGSVASPLQGLLALPAPYDGLVSLAGWLTPFQWNWITIVVAPIVIGLLYLSWLAGWWVLQQKEVLQVS